MSMIAAITKQSMEGKGPLSFEQILTDPVNLNYFKKFCALPAHKFGERARLEGLHPSAHPATALAVA